MRTDERIASHIPTASPTTSGASPAGREPNPILIAQHRSQEPPGIAAGVATLGIIPSQHPTESPPSPSPATCLPSIVWWPWALRFNYSVLLSDAGGQEPLSPLAGNVGRCWALPHDGGERHRPITRSAKPNSPLECQIRAEFAAPAAAHTSALAGCHHRPHGAGMSAPCPSSPTDTQTATDLQSMGEILEGGGNPKRSCIPGCCSPQPPKFPRPPPRHHQGASTKS